MLPCTSMLSEHISESLALPIINSAGESKRHRTPAEEEELPVNHEYKSDVFSMLLEEPENALSIYNALNGTSYSNPEEVEIFRLEKGISLTVRNDASFIIDANLNLYEHQSTYNPNMPMRSLIYVSRLFERLMREKNLYGRRRVSVPNVHFVVFYNGTEDQPAKEIMKLSDAYMHPDCEPELELVCTVYNINSGYNEELKAASQLLREYMQFVNKVRDNRKYMEPEAALNMAIDDCIKEHILEEFLRTRREEVTRVAMLDYTFERQIELEKRDSKAEGKAEGIVRGRLESILELLSTIGPIPEGLERWLRSVTDMNELNRLLKAAAKATSMDAFEAEVKMMKS